MTIVSIVMLLVHTIFSQSIRLWCRIILHIVVFRSQTVRQSDSQTSHGAFCDGTGCSGRGVCGQYQRWDLPGRPGCGVQRARSGRAVANDSAIRAVWGCPIGSGRRATPTRICWGVWRGVVSSTTPGTSRMNRARYARVRVPIRYCAAIGTSHGRRCWWNWGRWMVRLG